MHNPRPLCVAAHCAIRNRHLPDCPVEGCWGCLPRYAADGLALCDVDVRRLAEDAVKDADLHAALEQAIIRSGGGSEGEKTSGSSSGAPVPDDEVMAIRSHIRGTLLAIVRLVTEQRGITWPTERFVHHLPEGVEGPREIRTRRTEDLAVAAVFVGRHAEWIAAHRYAAPIAKNLREIAGNGRIWALAYPAGSDRLYVGNCPAILTDDDGVESTCGARLYQYPNQPLIACSSCGVEDTIEQWRRWIMGDTHSHVDAYAVAAHLAMMWMRPVDPLQIRRWSSKGRISPILEPDPTAPPPPKPDDPPKMRPVRDGKGRTIYELGPVIAYAESLWGSPVAQERRRSA